MKERTIEQHIGFYILLLQAPGEKEIFYVMNNAAFKTKEKQ